MENNKEKIVFEVRTFSAVRIIKALHEIRNETTIATMYRIGNLNNLVIARTNPTLFINIFSLRPECCVVLRSTKA